MIFLFRYKLALADVVIEKINPIRTLIEEYMDEPQYLNHLLQEGAKRAEIIAITNWLEVRNKVGYGIGSLSILGEQIHSQGFR